MIRTALAAALALALGGPALAADGLDAAFGNTIVSTYPDGRTSHLWLKADKTYSFEGRRKTPSSGQWRVAGEKICLKQQKPRGIPFSYCTAVVKGGVGTVWDGKAPTGEKIKLELVQGVVH